MDQIENKELLSYEEYVFPMMKFVEKIDDDYSLYQVSNDKDLAKAGDVMKNCISADGRYEKESLYFVIDKNRKWKAAVYILFSKVIDIRGKKNSPVDEHTLRAFEKWVKSPGSALIYKNKNHLAMPECVPTISIQESYKTDLWFNLFYLGIVALGVMESVLLKTYFILGLWVGPSFVIRKVLLCFKTFRHIRNYQLKLCGVKDEDIEKARAWISNRYNDNKIPRQTSLLRTFVEKTKYFYNFGNR